MVSTAEKYALEIEIFTLNIGFRAQISRSCAQKKGMFSSQYLHSLKGPTFSTQSAKSGRSLFKKFGAIQTADCSHWLLHDSLPVIALLANQCWGSHGAT
jgi:hypothetical protein